MPSNSCEQLKCFVSKVEHVHEQLSYLSKIVLSYRPVTRGALVGKRSNQGASAIAIAIVQRHAHIVHVNTLYSFENYA